MKHSSSSSSSSSSSRRCPPPPAQQQAQRELRHNNNNNNNGHHRRLGGIKNFSFACFSTALSSSLSPSILLDYWTSLTSRRLSIPRILTYVLLIVFYDVSWHASLPPESSNPQGILHSSSLSSSSKVTWNSNQHNQLQQQQQQQQSSNKIVVPHRRDIPLDPPRHAQARPTHHACEGYNGIFHIQSGDVGGAGGTIFFQFVLAQIYYARQYNFKPWIFLNNVSHFVYDWNVHGIQQQTPQTSSTSSSSSMVHITMLDGLRASYHPDPRYERAKYPGIPVAVVPLPLPQRTFFFVGDGVWEHYFEPVSDFVPGDRSCKRKPRLTMDLWLITPGLHIFAPWTPRMWKYDVLPDYMEQRHVPLHKWLTPQRIMAHGLTQEYIFPKPFLWNLAERYVPRRRIRQGPNWKNTTTTTSSSSSSKSGAVDSNNNKKKQQQQPSSLSNTNTSNYALGIHVRWSDKEGGRRKIAVDEFLPYVQEYVQEGGRKIFVATDSNLVLKHMLTKWPKSIQAMIVSQGQEVVRSDTATPVFTMASHHRTNVEILVDILALSNCAFMLHGLSAVSDAAMYMEYDLIYQSVNLEDPLRPQPDEFGRMVHMVMTGQVTDSHYWNEHAPKDWWEQYNTTSTTSNTTNHDAASGQVDQAKDVSVVDACDGYKGILHIAVGGDKDDGVDMVFFNYILNQLLYADMYRLKPWIYLSNQTIIYDEQVHGEQHMVTIHSNLTMDVYVPDQMLPVFNQTLYYPGPPMVMLPGAVHSNIAQLQLNSTNSTLIVNSTNNTTATTNNNSTSKEDELYEYEDDKPPPRELVMRLAGNGIWNTYMEPVSDFHPNDTRSCNNNNKQYVSLDYAQVIDGLAVGWPWAIHPYRVDKMADPILWKPPNMTYADFFEPMRRKGHELVQKYFRFQPYLIQRADEVNPPSHRPCLAMHIRRAGRGGTFRKRVPLKTFRDYARAYVRAGGKHIFMSVDSWRVWDDIHEKWPQDIRDIIITQGDYVVRTVRHVNLYVLDPDAHHRINSEALVDILAMSKCQYMLHGNSATSEAVMYLNFDLRKRSINLEEERPMSMDQFEQMVQQYEPTTLVPDESASDK